METSARLAGRVALVTGGGGEIGQAICRRLADEGARVAVSDIDLSKARQVEAEINRGRGDAISICLDVSSLESANLAVRETVNKFGTLTILVNAAAIQTRDGTAETLDLAEWERVIRINLSGAFIMCKASVPELRKSGKGNIVNIASQLGHLHIFGRAPYCTSKAALIALTKMLAIDFASDGIRANSISPGFVLTQMSASRYGTLERAKKIQAPKHLLNRSGNVHDVAAGVAYLASDDAAFVTGIDLLIDGGYVTFKGVIGENGQPTM